MYYLVLLRKNMFFDNYRDISNGKEENCEYLIGYSYILNLTVLMRGGLYEKGNYRGYDLLLFCV